MSENNEVAVDESIGARCVALLIESPDIPVVRVAAQLNISRHKAKRLMESLEVQSQLADISNRILEVAANKFKSRMQELEPLAFEALRQNLRDKRIEAVKVWAQLVGLSDKKDVEQKESTIQIIMPSMRQPQDVISEVKDE